MDNIIDKLDHQTDIDNNMYNECVRAVTHWKNEYDKLKEQNNSLLEALKELVTQFEMVDPLYSTDKKYIKKAKEAIKKTQQ